MLRAQAVHQFRAKKARAVQGMYIKHYGGKKGKSNPFPSGSEEDPGHMAPCPSCQVNHKIITNGVNLV